MSGSDAQTEPKRMFIFRSQQMSDVRQQALRYTKQWIDGHELATMVMLQSSFVHYTSPTALNCDFVVSSNNIIIASARHERQAAKSHNQTVPWRGSCTETGDNCRQAVSLSTWRGSVTETRLPLFSSTIT